MCLLYATTFLLYIKGKSLLISDVAFLVNFVLLDYIFCTLFPYLSIYLKMASSVGFQFCGTFQYIVLTNYSTLF